MENINGKSRASFPWTFSRVTMGLAVSVSLCFAQGNRDASRDLQRVQEVQRLLGPCDSLDPKVCFDIYQRRTEQLPERIPDKGWPSREFGQAMVGKVPFPCLKPEAFETNAERQQACSRARFPLSPKEWKEWQEGTRIK
jgi:hypothetical protein